MQSECTFTKISENPKLTRVQMISLTQNHIHLGVSHHILLDISHWLTVDECLAVGAGACEVMHDAQARPSEVRDRRASARNRKRGGREFF